MKVCALVAFCISRSWRTISSSDTTMMPPETMVPIALAADQKSVHQSIVPSQCPAVEPHKLVA